LLGGGQGDRRAIRAAFTIMLPGLQAFTRKETRKLLAIEMRRSRLVRRQKYRQEFGSLHVSQGWWSGLRSGANGFGNRGRGLLRRQAIDCQP
jgi:hypothetical protein